MIFTPLTLRSLLAPSMNTSNFPKKMAAKVPANRRQLGLTIVYLFTYKELCMIAIFYAPEGLKTCLIFSYKELCMIAIFYAPEGLKTCPFLATRSSA
jgi:hypothetical protein